MSSNAVSPEEIKYLCKLEKKELQERYVELQSDFVILKKFTRSQEDKIRRLQTKLQKLTSDYIKSKRTQKVANSSSSLTLKQEDEIHELQQRITQLQKKSENLEGRLKLANLQLNSAKLKKIPSIYRHINSRTDSGLQNKFKSRSLINVATRKNPKHGRKFSSASNISLEDSVDSDQQVDSEMNHSSPEVQYILEEARSRILELEMEREQLIQQTSEIQQSADLRQKELEDKIENLEKNSFEKISKEHKDKAALIRSERHNRSANSRLSSLADQLADIEQKLNHEVKCKEDALEEVDKLKWEMCQKEAKSLEASSVLDQLKSQIQELKETNVHVLTQNEILERENRQLSQVRSSSKKKKTKEKIQTSKHIESNQQVKYALEVNTSTASEDDSYITKLLQEISSERELRAKAEIDVQKLQLTNERLCQKLDEASQNLLQRRYELKEGQGSSSRNTQNMQEKSREVLDLMSEISKEKSLRKQIETEMEKLKIMNEKLNLKLREPNQTDNSGATGISSTVESVMQEFKQKEKLNIYSQMAFNELKSKYTELQLLYAEKNTELEKLCQGRGDTHHHLMNEKDELRDIFNKLKEEAVKTAKETDTILSHKNSTINNLEKQLITLKSSINKDNESHSKNSEDAVESLSLTKHYNILEFTLEKIDFCVTHEEVDKTMKVVCWVMPFLLKNPLQHSPPSSGVSPRFNHSEFYKFRMNFKNFSAILKEPMKVGVYAMLSGNLPFKFGHCSLFLNELLQHPQDTLHGTASISLDIDDEVEIPQGDEVVEEVASLRRVFENNEDVIGVLYYSLRFLKDGKDHIKNFQNRISIVNSENQNSRRNSDANTSSSSSVKVDSSKIKNEVLNTQKFSSKLEISEPKSNWKNNFKTGDKIPLDDHEISDSSCDKSGHISDTPDTHISNTKETQLNINDSNKEYSSSTKTKNSKFSKEMKNILESTLNEDLNKSSRSSLASIAKDIQKHEEEPKQISKSEHKKNKSNYYSQEKKPFSKSVKNEDKVFKKTKSEHEKVTNSQVDELSKKRNKFSTQLKNVFRSKLLSTSKSVEDKTEKMAEGKKTSKLQKRSLSLKSDHRKPNENQMKSDQSDSSSEGQSKGSEGSEDEVCEENRRNLSTPLKKSSKKFNNQIGSKKDETETNEEEEDSGSDSSSNGTEDEINEDEESVSENSENEDKDSVLVSETSSDQKNSLVSSARAVSDKKNGHSHSDSDSDEPEHASVSNSRSASSDEDDASDADESDNSEVLAEEGMLTLEVISFEVEKDSDLAEDENHQNLFVDFIGFLGLDPEMAETPEALPKPPPEETALFNFISKIDISKSKTPKRLAALDRLLKTKGEIRFNLASEPAEDNPELDCQDVGYAVLDIKSTVNGFEGKIAVKGLEEDGVVGHLCIKTHFEKKK